MAASLRIWHATGRSGQPEGRSHGPALGEVLSVPVLPAADHHCAECGALLFRGGDAFFDEGGDLCFSAPASLQTLTQQPDQTGGARRVALHCAACDSQVGHVFPDGPFPTGLRYRVEPALLPFRARH